MFLGFWAYYLIAGSGMAPNYFILMTPLLILQMAALGLGFGVIISSMTTKYRDLAHLVGFGVQLWMYATPVAYDIGIIPEKYMIMIALVCALMLCACRPAVIPSGAPGTNPTTKPTSPTQPTDPTDPTEPTEPPTEPTEPPTEPTDPTEPSRGENETPDW